MYPILKITKLRPPSFHSAVVLVVCSIYDSIPMSSSSNPYFLYFDSIITSITKHWYFWLRQELKKCKSLSVCLMTIFSELTIYIFLHDQVSLSSFFKLSFITLYNRRSLKYFVLFILESVLFSITHINL